MPDVVFEIFHGFSTTFSTHPCQPWPPSTLIIAARDDLRLGFDLSPRTNHDGWPVYELTRVEHV